MPRSGFVHWARSGLYSADEPWLVLATSELQLDDNISGGTDASYNWIAPTDIINPPS